MVGEGAPPETPEGAEVVVIRGADLPIPGLFVLDPDLSVVGHASLLGPGAREAALELLRN